MPGQVRGAAGAGDDHPDPAPGRRLGVAEQVVGRPVRGDDPQLARDAELGEHGLRLLEDREVATGSRRRSRRPAPLRARHPATSVSVLPAQRGARGPRARARASSASVPTTVTWPILRRSKTRRLP